MAKTQKSNSTKAQGYYGRISSCYDDAVFACVTGTRPGTKLRQILKYLDNTPATKYEIVTNVLGKVGSKTDLRGYYCTNLASMRNAGLINYDYETKLYSLADRGIEVISEY